TWRARADLAVTSRQEEASARSDGFRVDSRTCFDPGEETTVSCRPRAYAPNRSEEEGGQRQHRQQHSPATERPPGPRMGMAPARVIRRIWEVDFLIPARTVTTALAGCQARVRLPRDFHTFAIQRSTSEASLGMSAERFRTPREVTRTSSSMRTP